MVASVAVAQSDFPTTVESLGPVGYWRFNETATAPAVNKVVNASTLGSVLDAAVILDVGKAEPGIVGTSVRLKNPGVAAGYCGSKLDVPFNAALNKAGPFSVELWIKPASLGSDTTGMAILSSLMGDFAPSQRTGYLIYLNSAGRFEFRLGNSGGYVGTVNNADKPQLNAATDKWRHVVCLFDGVQTQIIVDGQLAASRTLTAVQISSLAQNTQVPFRIGGTAFNGSLSDGPASSAGGVSGNRGIDAWVDEVAFYPYALTTAQAAAHFTAGTTTPAGYGTVVLADNPVGYWPMDDAAVTPPNPSTYPVVQNTGSVGSAANGTVVWGGLTDQPGTGYSGFGAADKALSLDGANGFVKVGTATGLDITGNITLAAWVKPTVKNFFRNVIARGWDVDYKETFLRIARGTDLGGTGFGTTNHYEIGVTDGSNYYDSVLVPMPEGDIGNWVFLAGTYDGAQWTLYRNGKSIGTLASPNGPLATANAWAIGGQSEADTGGANEVPGGLSTFFGGGIDEPAIFDRALSAADIKALYDAAKVSPVITKSIMSPDGYLNSRWPTLFKGGSATLSVWAEGAEPLTYAWTKDGVPIPGATSTNLVINNLDAGTPVYAVTVSNANGVKTDTVQLNVVIAPPSFAANPTSVARFAGSSFTLTAVTAGSTPQTFQWKLNGVPIDGATAASYTGTALLANNGLGYTCTASNAAGEATSAPAVLTVLPAATGYAASVLDSAPIAYWRLGETTGSTAFDYVGNNNGVYSKVTLGQAGYAALDSNGAAVFSGDDSFIGQISGTSINFEGKNTSFSIECWAKGPEGLVDESTLVAKGTGSEGTTANEQFVLDVTFGKYRFMTRGNNNTAYSAEAEFGPDGSWQHVVGVYDQSDPASPQMRIYVNGKLSGSGPGRPAVNNGVRPSTSPISIGSKRLGNAPVYDGTFNGSIDEVAIYPTALSEAVIEARYGSAYGNNTPPQITLHPKASTNYITLSTTFTVSAYGTIPLAYQWKKNGGDISGATASTYTVPSVAGSDAAEYTVVVSNPVSSVTSNPARLSVLPIPSVEPFIPGLVAHLTFDNTLVDRTGRGNNGTAIRQTQSSSNVTTATYVDGRIGQAVSYSSDFGVPAAAGATTTTNTSYVTLGVRPDFQFGTNTSFTIAFWIRLQRDFIGGDLPFFTTTSGSLGGQGVVLAPAYGYGNGGGAEPDPAPLNYGGWGASLYDSGAANGARIYGDLGSINDGDWHHLVYVFDRSSQLVTYLDGSPAKATKISGTTTANAKTIDTGLAATIGQDPTGRYAETGSGDMDDLGVWRRAISPLEAAALFVAGRNNLSFVGRGLTIARSGATYLLEWDGQLQESTSLAGPYTDVVGAVSPLPISGSGDARFYKVK